jgi:hypothetical protein
VIHEIKRVKELGGFNGLHKSLSATKMADEFERLKIYDDTLFCQRYHFLKFDWPQACIEIEQAGIKLDSSLGFAEHIGFRNSYGLPFKPYDMANDRPYNFIEVPLNIMDRTLQMYMQLDPEAALKQVKQFFETNAHNCIVTLLWHNEFFSPYQPNGFGPFYKGLLEYLYQSDFKSVRLDLLDI